MSAPQHLNTIVKGSVGMLQEAAAGLRKGKQAAEQADEANHTARDIAHANWRGGGAEAFLEDLKPHLNFTRDLVTTSDAYARAFDDLAGALEVVRNDMEKVRRTAIAGGLQVHGPIVMRPEGPGAGPKPSQYPGDTAAYQQAAQAHQGAIADFNAKAQTFNTCLAVFKGARNKEKQAHTEFWETLEAGRGFDLGGWNIGTTNAAAALNVLAGMHNTRASLLTSLQGLETHSQAFQRLASGATTLQGLSAKQRMYVMQSLARSKGSEVNYRRQLKQLDKISKVAPTSLQRLAAANPGQVMPNTKLGNQLTKVFKRLPWAGSGLTVGNELIQSATGEQTWGKGVADSAGILASGALGGMAGAWLCAPIAPVAPWAPIVCGAAGAWGGAILGENVSDFVVPEEKSMPQPVDKIAVVHRD